ncbi:MULTISPECIES: ABC transporter ATP-binding protein [Enterocloster]|mgnify:FL=1|uniref:Nickel import system ATP-binding protein NikD n=1 Tax=Enterocloster lavalensis TaxID=460384 RepID=A0A1I0D6G3_9FIRM|nr:MULTISPECIES: ABC transporter ATP-binding protein [Enterocloster]MDR3755253.1 ABC transporter ATP-binding protein [Enterocloster sp.]PST35346.1 ABC transporter ATP-binding protein [Enterocloster lavalensis]SET27506.1 peptide/nickel transport system ATP-binding protein [Enterocloster lavalensis]
MEEKRNVLSIEHLSISFSRYERRFRRTNLNAIRDLSLTVGEGEMVAVVGASGSGKSLLAHAVLGILPYNASWSGTMNYRGEILTEKRMKALRGKEIVLVPQSVSYLDPLMRVGEQVRNGKQDRESRKKSLAVLGRYGLDEKTERLFPFQLSGGMTRRILISTAVMETPRLVIADEPTPGLHITAARRVLSHFREIADQGAGVLLITHDLELALDTADRIVVFYAGTNLEEADSRDFAREQTLRHPYSRALFRAMPEHGFSAAPGAQPFAGELPEGCPYGPRCPWAQEVCRGEVPYRELRGGMVRCARAEWLMEQDDLAERPGGAAAGDGGGREMRDGT